MVPLQARRRLMADTGFRLAALERRPLKDALAHASQVAEARIGFALSTLSGAVPEAMLYAVKGGKALRAFLALESARLHDINPAKALRAAQLSFDKYCSVSITMAGCVDVTYEIVLNGERIE